MDAARQSPTKDDSHKKTQYAQAATKIIQPRMDTDGHG